MLNKNKKEGFTLIELLVVIAIIGMLAAGVMVSMGSARSKARDARRISDIKNLDLAITLYFDSSSTMPFQLSDLVTAGFIKSVPTDPSTLAPYSYVSYGKTTYGGVTRCSNYHLGTVLEQGNTALASDQDTAPANQTNICNGTAFAGSSADCGATQLSNDSSDKCFDVGN